VLHLVFNRAQHKLQQRDNDHVSSDDQKSSKQTSPSPNRTQSTSTPACVSGSMVLAIAASSHPLPVAC